MYSYLTEKCLWPDTLNSSITKSCWPLQPGCPLSVYNSEVLLPTQPPLSADFLALHGTSCDMIFSCIHSEKLMRPSYGWSIIHPAFSETRLGKRHGLRTFAPERRVVSLQFNSLESEKSRHYKVRVLSAVNLALIYITLKAF